MPWVTVLVITSTSLSGAFFVNPTFSTGRVSDRVLDPSEMFHHGFRNPFIGFEE